MDPEIAERVARLERVCLQREWTVGLAESCTGGLLSSWICAYPGVSRFFVGAVVSYARSVKESVLRVPSPLVKTHGEVSLPVATAMAKGAREVLSCDWSVSLTGIAGPSGGTAHKPVGTVCFAILGPGFEEAICKHFPVNGGRQDIQRQAALFAFDSLLNAIR
ncbi:MAG: CinA family protein [Bdellovibrionales bacterium]